MILYDLIWIDSEDKCEYPIADGITIYEALDAINKDIKEHGLYDTGHYRLFEYNEENEQD